MTVMTMTITTTMMTTRIPACNVCNQHTHRLSFTDGRSKRRAGKHFTMIAPNALTNTYGGNTGGGSTIGHTLFSDAQRAPVAGSFSFGGHGGPIT